VKTSIDSLKVKFSEIQKEKSVNKSLKWESISKIISNYNIFKNFCIVRGYKNIVSKEVNEDLIYIDNKRTILKLKTFIENNSNNNNIPVNNNNLNNNNYLISTQHNIFKMNSAHLNNLNLNNKYEVNGLQLISLKFDYIISLFHNKIEEVPLISDADEENLFISQELEKILNSHFANLFYFESKKNIIINYISDLFSKEKLSNTDSNAEILNDNIVKLIETFIKLVNLNTTKMVVNNSSKTKKVLNNKFDFFVNILTNEGVSKIIDFRGIDTNNNLIFDLDNFLKILYDIFSRDINSLNSIFAIHLKLIYLNNDSQINLLISNSNNQDFILSLLKRGKIQNQKKFKKDPISSNYGNLSNLNNNLNNNNNINTSLNTESKNQTTMNNKSLNTSINSSLDNIFEDIEIKYSNVYISILDIKADFNLEEKFLPIYCIENIEEAKKKLNEDFYRSSRDLENSKIQNKSLRSFSNSYTEISPIYVNNKHNFLINLEDSKTKNLLSYNFNKALKDLKKVNYTKDNIMYSIEGKTIKEFGKFYV